MSKVLMLASGPSAKQVHDYAWRENGWTIVSINNGWRVTDEWEYWVRPGDFTGPKPTEFKDWQKAVERYSVQLGKFGGQRECGYSITLNAGYWALSELNPTVMGFLGADMNYTPDKDGNTHFYGVGWDVQNNAGGLPDPDRMVKMYGKDNPNYLHDIYMRLSDKAQEHNGCKVVNFSNVEDTRLPYPKANPRDF
jgi:hypothetical protein